MMTYDLNLVFVKVKPLEDMMFAGDLRKLITFELESRLIGLLRNIAVQELEKSGVERKGCEQVEAFCDALLQVEPESLLCDDATIFQLKQVRDVMTVKDMSKLEHAAQELLEHCQIFGFQKQSLFLDRYPHSLSWLH